MQLRPTPQAPRQPNRAHRLSANAASGASTCRSLQDLLDILRRGVRLDVIRCLAELGGANVSTIAAFTGREASSVSHVLSHLSKSHLVECAQDAQRHVYRLTHTIGVNRSPDELELQFSACDGGFLTLSIPRK